MRDLQEQVKVHVGKKIAAIEAEKKALIRTLLKIYNSKMSHTDIKATVRDTLIKAGAINQ